MTELERIDVWHDLRYLAALYGVAQLQLAGMGYVTRDDAERLSAIGEWYYSAWEWNECVAEDLWIDASSVTASWVWDRAGALGAYVAADERAELVRKHYVMLANNPTAHHRVAVTRLLRDTIRAELAVRFGAEAAVRFHIGDDDA